MDCLASRASARLDNIITCIIDIKLSLIVALLSCYTAMKPGGKCSMLTDVRILRISKPSKY
jgi:hypothetical protein